MRLQVRACMRAGVREGGRAGEWVTLPPGELWVDGVWWWWWWLWWWWWCVCVCVEGGRGGGKAQGTVGHCAARRGGGECYGR